MYEQRIKKVMAHVFDISEASIDNISSPRTIKKWNSLAHMNLVLSLEDEFSINFSDEQIISMRDFQTIVQIINDVVPETINT